MFDLAATPAIFLQPHADDVALSCGGTVAKVVQAGQIAHVTTVFAGEVLDAMVGRLAAWKHDRWQLDGADAVRAVRRAEDAAAAARLGCSLRWLGLPDAIYRTGRYESDNDLFAPMQADESELAAHLAEELLALPEWLPSATLFVPLGAGNHVDHQIVFECGALLAARGLRVLAYEDTPYVIHTPAGLPARRSALAGRLGRPVTIDIEATLGDRLAAIGYYASQLPVIFRFTSDYRAAVTAYAYEVGGTGAAERFWPVIS